MSIYSPITDGLVFSMQGGSLVDTAKNNTITNNGATATTDHNGRAARGWAFTTGQNIRVTDNFNFGTQNTAEIHFNSSSIATAQNMIQQYNGTGSQRSYLLRLTSSRIQLLISSNGVNAGIYQTTTIFSSDTDYFCHITFNAGVVKLYLAGTYVEDLILSSGTAQTSILNTSEPLYFSGASSEYLLGKMDTARLYSRPLSVNEIQKNYNYWLSH